MAKNRTDIITIYHPSGSEMKVMYGDYVDYYSTKAGGGWSSTKSTSGKTTIPEKVKDTMRNVVQEEQTKSQIKSTLRGYVDPLDKPTTIYRPDINGNIQSRTILKREVPYETPNGWQENRSYWTSDKIKNEVQIQTEQRRGGTRQQAEQRVSSTPAETGRETVTQADIPFARDLTDSQMQSIMNLVSARPSTNWTDTDIKNWNYATNNAPLPAEKDLIKQIQQDPDYNAQIEGELKQYFPQSEYPDFDWFYYTSEDETAGTIPSGKKVGDLTSEGEAAQTSARAQWEPYYQSEYEESLISPTTTKTRTAEDVAEQKQYLTEERGAYLEKESRDYQQTLNQYKKSFGSTGLTFSGRAQETLGTQAAIASEKPGLLELERAYNLGKYERDYGRAMKTQEKTLSRSIEDYENAKKMAELSRNRGLGTAIATGVAQREDESLSRYKYGQELWEKAGSGTTLPESSSSSTIPATSEYEYIMFGKNPMRVGSGNPAYLDKTKYPRTTEDVWKKFTYR